MKFCTSVYMNIVKAFKIPSAFQVEIGNSLLEAVTGEHFVRYDDGQISDLFYGKKNVGDHVLAAAKNLDTGVYLRRFEKTAMPLIDANELASVVAAIRNVIAQDERIRPQTVVEPLSKSTKHEVALCGSVHAPGFLAGTFLYTLLNVENKGTRADARAIDEAFIERARGDCDAIALRESPGQSSVEARTLWGNGSNSISVVAGDIFNRSESETPSDKVLVTIPVDTSFSAELAGEIEGGDPFLVSPKTLHGKFLKMQLLAGNTGGEIRQRIEKELDLAGCTRDPAGHFPVGSIATIDDGNTSYCLLAVAEHDAHGNTQSTRADIEKAVTSLALHYDRRGLGYPLLVPLIGTGRSRAGLGYQESFELIVKCLVGNKEHIQGDVIVVVLPEAFEKLDTRKAEV